VPELGLDRFLDLQDHLGLAPRSGGVGNDPGPGGDELLVGDGGARARAGLDVDLVSRDRELADPRGRDGHAVLVVLDLLRHADAHPGLPFDSVGVGRGA
jgi:hypothetical protein